MIRRLNHNDIANVLEFISRIKDNYQDFYITLNKQRVFLTDYKLIKKLLKYQEMYAIDDGQIHAILLIYREKGFRPYIKLLAEQNKFIHDLLKSLNWHFNEEIFIKAKKFNPITNIAQTKNRKGFAIYGFEFLGARGKEILLIRRKREIIKNDYHNPKS